MRRIFLMLVLLGIAYFAVGWFVSAKYPEYFPRDRFLEAGTVIGGLLSALSLISLAGPRISRKDIDEIGDVALQRVSEAATNLKKQQEDLERTEGALAKTNEELETLQRAKREIALIVRQEVMYAGLREGRQQSLRRLEELVHGDPEILRLCQRIQSIESSMKELKQEIDRQAEDPAIKVIRTALRARSSSEGRAVVFQVFGKRLFASGSPFAQIIYHYVKALNDLMSVRRG